MTCCNNACHVTTNCHLNDASLHSFKNPCVWRFEINKIFEFETEKNLDLINFKPFFNLSFFLAEFYHFWSKKQNEKFFFFCSENFFDRGRSIDFEHNEQIVRDIWLRETFQGKFPVWGKKFFVCVLTRSVHDLRNWINSPPPSLLD